MPLQTKNTRNNTPRHPPSIRHCRINEDTLKSNCKQTRQVFHIGCNIALPGCVIIVRSQLSSDDTAALALLSFLRCANTQRYTECYKNSTADSRHRPLNQQGGETGKESETAHSTNGAQFTTTRVTHQSCSGRASIPQHHTVNVSIHNHSPVSIKQWSRSPLSFTAIDLAQRSSPIGSLIHVPDETIITTPPINQMMSLIIYSFCSSGLSSCNKLLEESWLYKLLWQ